MVPSIEASSMLIADAMNLLSFLFCKVDRSIERCGFIAGINAMTPSTRPKRGNPMAVTVVVTLMFDLVALDLVGRCGDSSHPLFRNSLLKCFGKGILAS